MAFAAFFLAALVGHSSLFFLEEPGGHGFKGELGAAIIGGMGLAVYGTMLLMSIYMWAAYYVERFTINGTTLSIRSMFQNRQFDIAELHCLTWKANPMGGSILFNVLGSKTRLDLHGYAKDDRLSIIRALHSLVPPQLQQGWALYCHHNALPLRDGKPSIVRTVPASELFTITRRRYDRMVVFGFPLSIVVAIALWQWLAHWPVFVLPLLVIAGWLLLRFSVPPEGRSEERLTSTSIRGRGLFFGLGAILSSWLLLFGLPFLGVDKSIAFWIACPLMVAALAPVLYAVHKLDKQRRAADQQAAELAPARWQHVEGTAACCQPEDRRSGPMEPR